METKQAMAMLEEYLVSGPMDNGDYDARCPLHEDSKRSARINFDKNVWTCFAGCGGGNLAGLLRRMRHEGLGNSTAAGKQPVRQRVGSVDPKDVERWHRQLLEDPHEQDRLWAMRGIDEKTVRRFRLGWDQASQAFTIPIYLNDGVLFNVRKYRPNAESDRKIWWTVKKDPNVDPPLFPAGVLLDSDWAVLCEGEMDAILATLHGFPAMTGTAGAGTWRVSWSEQFRGKNVIVVYDRDTSGERGARQVAEQLETFAKAIYVAEIPISKEGADVSDYFNGGEWGPPHSAKDFQQHVLAKAKRYQKRVTDPTEMDPREVSVMDSFDSQNVGRALSMDVLVSGRSQDPFSIPKTVRSTCTMDAGPKCKFCPMLNQHKGDYTYEVPAWSNSVLRMIQHPDASQQDALRKQIGALKCDKLRHDVQTYQTVEQLFIRPSWDEVSGDFTPRKVYSVGRHNTMPSQVVHMLGTTWPDPKEQRNQFIAWDVSEAESAIDEFRVSPEVVRQLRQFQPAEGQSALRKLGEIAQDHERHVTRIYGRLDLHMAIDLVYHSLIAFPFQGKLEPRGWLDALVIGDTRTGKSEVAQRLSEHYHAGFLINCEAATFAGIVGGLQQMGGSREWAVTWGAVPMNDRRMVILDEVSGLSYENIQAMSDVRSRGFVRLQKIQSEQAWARTRLLWLSNPRSESMDHYTYGVQAIGQLIGNREDIARFDFAMALTQHDVSLDQIQQVPVLGDPTYESEDVHALVLWAWSRTASDVVWEDGVEADVLVAAEWLGKRYISDPPLIQAANVRVKVARIAVALAAATFSTDPSGKRVVIKRGHVSGALRFLHGLYKRDTFGYYRMSVREIEEQRKAVSGMDDAKRWLLERRNLIRFLQSTQGGFRGDALEQMLNMRRDEANAVVNAMFEMGLVNSNGQSIKMSPVLHQLLREIEEEAWYSKNH